MFSVLLEPGPEDSKAVGVGAGRCMCETSGTKEGTTTDGPPGKTDRDRDQLTARVESLVGDHGQRGGKHGWVPKSPERHGKNQESCKSNRGVDSGNIDLDRQRPSVPHRQSPRPRVLG